MRLFPALLILAALGCGDETDPVGVAPLTDLSITLDAPLSGVVGTPIEINLVVTNGGPSLAPGAIARVETSVDVEFSASNSPKGGGVSLGDTTIEWTGFFLGTGFSMPLQFELTPLTAGQVVVTVFFESQVPESDGANNMVSVIIEVAAVG